MRVPVRTKTFSSHNRSKNEHDVRGKRFNAHEGVHVMQARAGTEGGAGIGSRKGRGPTPVGRTGGTLRPHPGVWNIPRTAATN